MSELVELFARALERREIGEHRHVMAELALVVMDAAQVLPLRVHLAILASVPDLAAPLAMLFQRQPHLVVEGCVVLAGREESRGLSKDFLGAVSGDAAERRIDVHDVLAWISDQHAFLSAVEDCGGLLQAGLLQVMCRSEEHTSELQSLMRNSYAVF